MASNAQMAKSSLSPWRAIVASVSGYALDGFDLLMLGFLLPAISLSLHLNAAEAGSLVTWTLIGAVIGGLVFGLLSDRYGRVRMLSFTIILFAVFTGLCAIAQGYWDLLFYRTIAGMGLGGEFGIGMALVAEVWPARWRNRASSWVGIGWQFGVLIAAFITPVLLPQIGWRGMFVVGLLPALIAFGLRHWLSHEAPAASSSIAKQAVRFNLVQQIRLLCNNWAMFKAGLGILILCAVQNFAYYGLMIWLPSFLSQQRGLTLMQSGTWTAVTVVGMIIGIGLFGWLADRFSRWAIFLVYQCGAAIMVIIYPLLTDQWMMLWAGALLGFFVNGMIGGYGALISDVYPLEIRATAQNLLFNLGRALGGFGPLLIGILALRISFGAAIALLALLYIVDIFATLFLLPRRQGNDDRLGAIG